MKVGIDLVRIDRFLGKEKIADKILSDYEYELYLKSSNKIEYLASRFAVKEALIKCLELNILSVNLKDIVVMKKGNGAIYVLYNDKKYNASLSHEKEYCTGVVIDE